MISLLIAIWLAVAFAVCYLVGGLIRRGRHYPGDPPTRSADDWWRITDQRRR